jgi:hypothetical protein
MVIYDYVKYKAITQMFLLLALLTVFVTAYILKRKKVEITYKVAFKLLMLEGFPIVAFPFIVFSTMSILDKTIATMIALSGVLAQFFGTIAFHKMIKKPSSTSDKV